MRRCKARQATRSGGAAPRWSILTERCRFPSPAAERGSGMRRQNTWLHMTLSTGVQYEEGAQITITGLLSPDLSLDLWRSAEHLLIALAPRAAPAVTFGP
jgi:hypothetical protein